jgi:hypothetical protein
VPTPSTARAAASAALASLVRTVYTRHIDSGSDLTASVRWTDWLEPVTGCRDGPVLLEVTLLAPAYTDPDLQAEAVDGLAEQVVPVLDRAPLIRRAVTTDVDDELGYLVRITVEVR